MRVAVLGAGAFGSALACALASAGRHVTLIARDAEAAERIREARHSPRLPGVRLPDDVEVDSEPPEEADVILVAVPAQKTRAALDRHLPPAPLVLCAKGLEHGALKRQSEIAAEVAPRRTVAALTGPGFAIEIARGLPTALTLACAAPEGPDLQRALATGTLRPYLTTDVVGAEIGGAVKNVIAIACGAAHGLGLGESARAALMTRGFAEMARVAVALGARAETLTGLSGMGDLALTCGSTQSRNFALGVTLASGGKPGGATQEGAATAAATLALAGQHGVRAPIADVVARLVAGEIDAAQALEELLSRPLRRETE